MIKKFVFGIFVSLILASCKTDEEQIAPKTSAFSIKDIKIDKILESGELYADFIYNNASLLKQIDFYSSGEAWGECTFEYDDDSQLISYTMSFTSNCCSDRVYELMYDQGDIVRINESRPHEPYEAYEVITYNGNKIDTLTKYEFNEHSEWLEEQVVFKYEGEELSLITIEDSSEIVLFETETDNSTNPFYGLPPTVMYNFDLALQPVPNNILSMTKEDIIDQWNEITYNDEGMPVTIKGFWKYKDIDYEIFYLQ